MDYPEIVSLLREFRDERNWSRYHNLKDLAISLNLEASEVLEVFQWEPSDHELTGEEKERLIDEMADTMIYLIYMFDKLGVEPGEAIKKKISYNRLRHWDKTE